MNRRSHFFQYLILFLIVIGGIVGFWYWQSRNATPATPTTNAPGTSPTQTDTISVVEEAGESIGAVIFEKTQDPLKENIPETNPLKRVMINPF